MSDAKRPKGKSAILDLPFPVYILFAVRLINAAGSFVLPFLTMILTRKLGWDESSAGSFITVTNLTGMGWTLASGKIADAVGRKRLIVASQIFSGSVLAVCAIIGMKPYLPWLLAPVIVASSGTWPAFNAVVADVSPTDRRKEAYSLLYWGNNVGFALGPLAAGFLFERNPSLMFLGNAVALFAVSSLLVLALKDASVKPEAQDPESARGDEADFSGSVFRALAKRPLVICFAAAMIILNFVYNQHLFSLPIRLNDIFGGSGPDVFGKLMSVNAITVVALTLPVTWLFRRAPPLINMAAASVFYALGFGLMGLSRASAAFYALTVVWTVGEILSATNHAAYVASRAPRSHRGRFNAVLNCISSAGSILCPAVSGAIISSWGSEIIWIVAGVTAAAGALAMLGLAVADGRRSSAGGG